MNFKKDIYQLPTPDKVYDWQGIRWEIFLAKNFSSQWVNETTHNLVLKCRQSFERYGEISLEDDYDNKSLVLLARVHFENENGQQEEFFSLRLIPAQGEPFLTEDLQVILHGGGNLYELIKDKLHFGHSESHKYIFTISRFCGLSLIPSNQNHLKHTTLSLVILWLFALEGVPKPHKDIAITAMFNRHIFSKVSRLKINNKEFVLSLPEIHETLSLSIENFGNFFPGPVAFHYPAYFFNLPELISWFRKIFDDKKINLDTIKHCWGTEIDWVQIEKELSHDKMAVIKKMHGLGKMLNGCTPLPGCKLNSVELRNDLEEAVKSSLVLKLIKLEDLEKILKKFLDNISFIV
ncbi:MAG: hypothetical protein WCV83_00210 [Candidatus Magasanikbacteria bacterium]|jgi:hypothetical protein